MKSLYDSSVTTEAEFLLLRRMPDATMIDDLGPKIIERIMPDRGLASIRAKRSPEVAKLPTEKDVETGILLESEPEGIKRPAREELLAAAAPQSDLEHFAPAAHENFKAVN